MSSVRNMLNLPNRFDGYALFRVFLDHGISEWLSSYLAEIDVMNSGFIRSENETRDFGKLPDV